MNANTVLLLIATISFCTMVGVMTVANKQSHNVVYGAVTVRGEVYRCEKWKMTKENR